MNKVVSFVKKNKTMLELVTYIALVFGAMQFTKTANDFYQELPVEGINVRNDAPIARVNFSALPLIFAQAPIPEVKKVETAMSPVDLDAAFLPPVAPIPLVAERIMPDLFLQLTNAISVGGVSNRGAFINGDYYPFGGKIQGLAYPGLDGNMRTPVLVGRDNQHLLIKETGQASGRITKVSF